MWYILTGILVISCIIFLKLRKSNKYISTLSKKINKKYVCSEGEFVVQGVKNKFIITKNSSIEFLVENGQIIACRDKRKSDVFVYYGGEM